MKLVIMATRIRDPLVASILTHLAEQEIPAARVIVARGDKESRWRFLAANLSRWLRPKTRTPMPNGIQPPPVSFRLGGFHSPRVLQYVRSLKPDIIMHAGGPIFRQSLLSLPRIGILNCHMGLLPEFRGMNVAEWSVLHGHPVGNTVHLIDRGIDTGAIVAFYPVDIADCRSVREMRERLIGQIAPHLSQAVKAIAAGTFKSIPQQPEAGRQYFKMHPQLKKLVENALSRGYRPQSGIRSEN